MPQKPKLGQNFLVDEGAAHAIAEALGDLTACTVVEIGPGRGAITGLLAERAQRLVLIELDNALAAALRERFARTPHVEVLAQDVLTTDLGALAAPGERLAVVGNLPYYITSDILLHLYRQHERINRAVVMVQREVAERVAALPGSSDYGMLSATTQLYADVELLFTLGPGSFQPPPKVQSSVLRLTMSPKFDALGVEPAGLLRLLRAAFAHKRKTLRNNLRAAGYSAEAVSAGLDSAGIHSEARAESLTLEQFARLLQALCRPSS